LRKAIALLTPGDLGSVCTVTTSGLSVGRYDSSVWSGEPDDPEDPHAPTTQAAQIAKRIPFQGTRGTGERLATP
jgi:hypothetical protein